MKLVLISVIFALFVTTEANGSFGVTYVTYSEYQVLVTSLRFVRLMPHPSAGDSKDIMRRHAMTCSRLCALNARCGSSYAGSSVHGYVICQLLTSNLCNDPSLDLTPMPGNGGRQYDKISDSLPPVSCNEDCIANNPGNCSACQRPGCNGQRCEICSKTCLSCYSTTYPNSTLQEEVECTLWLGMGNMYKNSAKCLGNHVLLFDRFNFPNGTSHGMGTFTWSICGDLVNTTQKFLYIELFSEYSTSPAYSATYSGFNCFNNKSISLGAWVNGSTSDGLGVPILPTDPFVQDATMYHPSCGRFWSRPVNNFQGPVNETAFGLGPCPGLATAFFGTPNVTNGVFTSGIAWATLPGVQLVGVKIYMY